MTENNNLPAALTRFIGREKEIAEIKRLLDHPGFRNLDGLSGARLLTLTGAGGAGKTRLALQVAQDLGRDDPPGRLYTDGVWLIELASLADPALVPQTAASVFDLRASGNLAPMDLLKNFLRVKNLLLVLDNCEHLIDACAQLAETLLTHCPDVKILATSREALNIAGEITFRVPSLALPNLQHLPPLEAFAHVEALRLFIERAQAAQPGFELTDANKSFIAQICARLDGMPLALELAAARVKTLAVEQIVARLDDRFRLLTTGSRTAPTRQQTLRATMDWSFDLLSAEEKNLFRRLAVFAGGWTLEAAEAIVGQDAILPHNVLDVLSRLVDKSLVNVETRDGETRYRMLETIRQYACEKLLESDEARKFFQRHLEWFTKYAKEADSILRSPEVKIGFKQLDIELENCRAALAWAFDNNQSADGAELDAALAWYFIRRGYYREAKSWGEKAERLTRDAPATPRADALFALGYALTWVGEYIPAEANMQQALVLYRNLDNRVRVGFALNHLGVIGYSLGKLDQAEQYWQEALAYRRAMGDQWGIAQTLGNLRLFALHKGDFARATAITEEGLTLSEQLGDEHMTARRLTNLGEIAYAQGDLKQAEGMLKRAVSTLWRMKEKWSLFMALQRLVQVIAAQGQPRRAAQIFSAIEFAREEWGAGLSEMERTDSSQVVSSIRAQIGDEDIAIAFNEGRVMTLEQAIEYALAEIKIPDAPAQSPRQIAKEKFDGLTAREREVAALIAQGKTNRDIADALVLSERTIEGHVGNILNKLGFNARAQIAAWAVERGLYSNVKKS
jgi:predicted ATPase/DNA-binding CsgD family transcriptional regulator